MKAVWIIVGILAALLVAGGLGSAAEDGFLLVAALFAAGGLVAGLQKSPGRGIVLLLLLVGVAFAVFIGPKLVGGR